jgi:hypothetical protein
VKEALLQLATDYAWYLAFGLVSLVLARRSQIDAWAESRPRVAGVLKLVRGLGLDPWLVVQSASLIVRGKLPAKPEAKDPK